MNDIDICPDCEGDIDSHNAVNRVPKGKVAHSADGGACWRSLNTQFTEHLENILTLRLIREDPGWALNLIKAYRDLLDNTGSRRTNERAPDVGGSSL